MIKLAIFGDSFADDSYDEWKGVWKDVGPSWMAHLKNTNEYQITNFAKSATSMYWSKKLFDRHYKEFDKIIFVVTFPCRRITFDKLPDGCNLFKTFYNASSVMDIVNDNNQFKKYNPIEQNFLKAMQGYYLYVQNDHFDHTIHSLMLDDIKEKKKDVILIPAFPSSVPSLDETGSSTLLHISQKDMHYFGLGDFMPNSNEMTDARKSHLNEENNLILANHMLKFLQGDSVYLDANKFVTPTKQLAHYFRKREL